MSDGAGHCRRKFRSAPQIIKGNFPVLNNWLHWVTTLPLPRRDTECSHSSQNFTLEHHQIIFHRKIQKLLLLNFFPVTREKKRLHIPDKSCIIQIFNHQNCVVLILFSVQSTYCPQLFSWKILKTVELNNNESKCLHSS